MMKFALTSTRILAHKSDCLIVGIAADKNKPRLAPAAKSADKALAGLVGEVCARGDFAGRGGQTLLLPARALAAPRVLLAGFGADDDDMRAGLDAAFARAAAHDGIQSLTADLSHLPADMAEYAVIAAARAAYRYHQGGHFPAAGRLKKFTFAAPRQFSGKRLARAAAAGEGVQLTCHLAEQPGNVCTPAFLGETAAALAKKTGLRAAVMDEKRMAKLGMGALLAVGRGGAHRPRFIVLEHRGGGKSAPVVLVGKGVTFDTGGISLKPGAAMDEMKFDMCGAATVLGAMLACAAGKMPLNVTGVIPACENMPDGNAIRPGDVIRAMSGKTIEVLNTDAEGRLILADALAYADSLKPAAVVDIATLTGACVIALGNHNSGLMSRSDALAAALQKAGDDAGDTCWRLPLGKKYDRQLKSAYADMANIGGRAAGTITAACFLSRFTECAEWAHLDIAGTAWTAKKRATGRPLPLLMRWLAARAAG